MKAQKLINCITGERKVDKTFHGAKDLNTGCSAHKCMGSILRPLPLKDPVVTRDKEQILADAQDFLMQFYEQPSKSVTLTLSERIEQMKKAVEETGTYQLTPEELEFGLKTAWRNAPRCIGRIQWKNLRVFDARHVTTGREMFEIIKAHLTYSTNGGNIRSAVTVFPHRQEGRGDYRVWNSLLVHFAGYRQSDGSIVGDPANVEFTEVCQRLGWKGPGGRFDILPIVIQAAGGPPEFFELPSELALKVQIKHPKLPWFEDLGLYWYAVPGVSSMMADIGGLEFTGCPFSGWFMSTEIGTRDLCDSQRYNILQTVAQKMGLETNQNASLWKDEALVEVNKAVIYSYQLAGVTLVDHHTASEQFMSHFETEHRIRGGCPADWVWIVPPMSGSLCPVFHQEMLNYKLKPSYEYQTDGWKTYDWGDTTHTLTSLRSLGWFLRFACRLLKKVLSKRPKCTILYATETGKSRTLAKKLANKASAAFNVKVLCMDEYKICDLPSEQLVFVVASTFGNGDAPQNGEDFYKLLKKEVTNGCEKYPNVRFGVFGLGSSNYPNFCSFAKNIDRFLEDLGGYRLSEVGTGDELAGQEEAFTEWANKVTKASMEKFNVQYDSSQLTDLQESKWTDFEYRLVTHQQSNVTTELCKWTKKSLCQAVVKDNKELQAPATGRRTVQVTLQTSGNGALSFDPGDHLAVLPQNDPKLVQDIMDLIKQDPDSPIAMQSCKKNASDWSWVEKFPVRGLTLRELLLFILDITTPLAQTQLMKLADLCQLKDGHQDLLTIATNSDAYQQWKSNHCPTLLEVLQRFPCLQELELSYLLMILPAIQPRYYSISSSPKLYPGEIHLTVAVVNYTTKSSSSRSGVCSNYLSNLKSGQRLSCFVRSAAKFHLPNDQSPLLLVGPGTGIAPLRGFWQHKLALAQGKSESVGDISLYHGCRYQNADNLYHEERQQMVQKKILNDNLTAFSRQTGIKKAYVQNLLSENGQKVSEQILKQNAHVYVCGDVTMAQEVRTTVEMILQQFGPMTVDKAQEYVMNMRAVNRYHEDIFGNMRDIPTQRAISKPHGQDQKKILKRVPSLTTSEDYIPYTHKFESLKNFWTNVDRLTSISV